MPRFRHLIPTIVLSACLFGCAPALAEESSPSPIPTASTVVVPAPSPAPTGHPWALGWAHQARVNRRALPRLAYCLGYAAPPRVPARPSPDASARTWNGYGVRCKHLAVSFVEHRKLWRHRLFHPAISNYADFRPLVRYYFDRGEEFTALQVIRYESGGYLRASNGACQGPWQLHSCWWAGHFDPHDPVASTKFAAYLQDVAGWRQWAVWPGCIQ